jgi:hypothetical protein
MEQNEMRGDQEFSWTESMRENSVFSFKLAFRNVLKTPHVVNSEINV